jgi:hypothetical protein
MVVPENCIWDFWLYPKMHRSKDKRCPCKMMSANTGRQARRSRKGGLGRGGDELVEG